MNGFRILFYLMLASIVVGLAMVYVPGCQPPDMGDCIWHSNGSFYDCPEENE